MRIGSKTLAAYLVILLLSIAVMLPVVTAPFGTMYGLPGDPNFRIWENWHFKYAFLNNEPLYFSDFIGAPFGADLSFMPYYIFWDKFFLIATLATNEIFSYNLAIFLSFFLSGITMFCLARYVTKDRGVALFSGILYMLCPYHLARSVGHFSLANIQWLPLFVLSVLKFTEDPKLKSSVFAGLSLALVAISSYYYGMFSYLMLPIILFSTVVINKIKIDRRIVLYSAISLLISILAVLVFIIPVYQNIAAQSAAPAQIDSCYTSPVKYLFAGSARPLSYLIPSYMHPIFGGFAKMLVGSPLYGDSIGENALYLGILPLLLSWKAVRRKARMSRIFLWLFIASLILSMPPYIRLFRLIIPLPQYLIFKAVPIFRTSARFGVYAMLCISVLAGLGLKMFLDKAESTRKRVFIYALLLIVVFFEFMVNPLKYTTDLKKPPEVYRWLSEQQGDFIICEYPLSKENDMRTEWLIWQKVHKKRKADIAFPGSEAAKIRKHIVRLQDKNTPRVLSWLGVKYVIVHTEDMKRSETMDIIGVLPDFNRQQGLKFVKRFEDVEVYEISARPLKPAF